MRIIFRASSIFFFLPLFLAIPLGGCAPRVRGPKGAPPPPRSSKCHSSNTCTRGLQYMLQRMSAPVCSTEHRKIRVSDYICNVLLNMWLAQMFLYSLERIPVVLTPDYQTSCVTYLRAISLRVLNIFPRTRRFTEKKEREKKSRKGKRKECAYERK